jgi:hypothetical protein
MTATPLPKKKRGRPSSGTRMCWQGYCVCGWDGAHWGGAYRRDAFAELRGHHETCAVKIEADLRKSLASRKATAHLATMELPALVKVSVTNPHMRPLEFTMIEKLKSLGKVA